MNEQELKGAWKEIIPKRKSFNIYSPNLVTNMEKEISRFESRIQSRDRREIIVAGVFILFFVAIAILEDGFRRVGSLLLISYFTWIIYYLVSVKTRQSFNVYESVRNQLLNYKSYVEKQRGLVKNVLYWYLLPIIPGVFFFLLDMDSAVEIIAILACLSFSFVYVYRLNRRAARENYDDLLSDLGSAIEGLEA